MLKSHAIAGDGGWDYLTVNPDSKQIYISHGNQVNIIKEANGDSVGVIKNTDGVHGIALVQNLNKGYISDGRANKVTVFNLANNKTTTTIPVGTNPDYLFYDDFSKKIFVFNGKSNNATVIDPKTDKVIATISLSGKPEAGVSDGKGQVFVNIEDKNEVVVLDANAFEVKNRYKIVQGKEPSGLAIDRVSNRLFIGCGGNKKMVIMDAADGKNMANFTIGGCDGVVFDPIYKLAYASNHEGFISVIREKDANNFEFVKNLPTEEGARTIAIDLKTHHLFTPTAKTVKVAPTPQNSHPWPKPVVGTFHVLEVGE
ncbi:YncE family protein [Pedobacter sp. UYP30]|uniref:YncE family protein n=1 Tax=Pedobacter sp. UYP30 TaxID=1756400 RepID=UPI0033948606